MSSNKRGNKAQVVAQVAEVVATPEVVAEVVAKGQEDMADMKPTEVIPESAVMSKDEQIKADIIRLRGAGKSVGYINTVVADNFSLSVTKVAAIHKKLLADEGLSKASGAQGDMAALVKCLRDNHGHIERNTLVKMMAEVSGYTESTANHMLSQLNFAKEWAKQELAAK